MYLHWGTSEINPIWSESEEELTNSHFEDLSTVLQSGTNLYFNELYFSKVWVFLFVFLFFNKVCGLRPRTTTMYCVQEQRRCIVICEFYPPKLLILIYIVG